MSPVWPPSTTAASAALNDAHAIRRAGRDVLSLALIESRNVLLHALAEHETPARLKRALQAGLFQEHWICGHVQRGRGEACDAHAPRLAGIERRVASWADPASPPPPSGLARAYLAEVLEIVLDLLSGTPDDDAALYFYRRALQQEDRLVERLLAEPRAGVLRHAGAAPPLWWPAQRAFTMGSAPLAPDGGPAGLVPQGERWAHALALPEFEIDARTVNWGQFVEFAEDGGYDRRELWSEAGWAWRNSPSTGAGPGAGSGDSRRAPAAVEQLGAGAVLWRSGDGKLRRVGLMAPVQGLTRHEAEAWCAWAGRRLPLEPEWECAALAGPRRGFAWGDVLEWVAGSARPWPEAGPAPPAEIDPLPLVPGRGGAQRFGVLRGAGQATPARWHHPRARRFASTGDSAARAGFRSCAL
ncbi:MAG: SUMF1/EgtB/PvdO family nonheme iron enzyme [Rubrivivax sp.]|jgi:iron(II)-dependent oxidoreductase|nr:SUMF1/EgtB/PvdO family nonheme iron enzyme [Rubrivivax sp.]